MHNRKGGKEGRVSSKEAKEYEEAIGSRGDCGKLEAHASFKERNHYQAYRFFPCRSL